MNQGISRIISDQRTPAMPGARLLTMQIGTRYLMMTAIPSYQGPDYAITWIVGTAIESRYGKVTQSTFYTVSREAITHSQRRHVPTENHAAQLFAEAMDDPATTLAALIL